MIRHYISAGVLALAGLAGAQAHAADYPARPITVVVPFTPGGGSDAVARLITSRIAQRTGKSIVINNKGGAGSNIGNEFVAHSTPDGYTFLLGQFSLSVNPYLYKHLQYKADTDFTPVVLIASSPTVLTVRTGSPFHDVKSIIQKAKAAPGSLNYGSGGIGTPPHLSGELFQRLTGTKMTHVPYKGSGPVIVDLISGRIDLDIDTSGSVLPQIKGGKLRALAIAGPKRLAKLPNVPTFAEVGIPGMDVPAWYGFLAPAKTPAAAIQWMNAQVNAVLKEPAIVDQLQQMGALPEGGSPQELGTFMQAQSKRWAGIIKSLHIRLN